VRNTHGQQGRDDSAAYSTCLDFFCLGFSLGLWPMFCFGVWCIINYFYVFVLISVFGIVVCLVSLLFPLEQR